MRVLTRKFRHAALEALVYVILIQFLIALAFFLVFGIMFVQI